MKFLMMVSQLNRLQTYKLQFNKLYVNYINGYSYGYDYDYSYGYSYGNSCGQGYTLHLEPGTISVCMRNNTLLLMYIYIIKCLMVTVIDMVMIIVMVIVIVMFIVMHVSIQLQLWVQL